MYRPTLPYIRSQTANLVAIVDFCGFKVKDLSESLPIALISSTKKLQYIFISTDSVYECFDGVDNSAVIAESHTESRSCRKGRDAYGWNKFQCEEFIREQMSGRDACTATILRLPDVFGPLDDTYRLWALYVLAKAGFTPRAAVADPCPIALVYSVDIVRFIDFCLLSPTRDAGGTRVVQLGCSEQLAMADVLALLLPNAPPTTLVTGCEFLPSVSLRRGPLDFARACKSFSFTPLAQALSETRKWMDEVDGTDVYRPEKRAMRRLIPRRLRLKIFTDLCSSSDSSSDSSSCTSSD